MQKARRHPANAGLRLIVGTRFQVLFHSPSGVLFTFPSRYWFTIGYRSIFSLMPWSAQIPTGFHVSRSTWVCQPGRSFYFTYRAITFCGRTFQILFVIKRLVYSPGVLQYTALTSHYPRYTTVAALCMYSGLGSSRFARRY